MRKRKIIQNDINLVQHLSIIFPSDLAKIIETFSTLRYCQTCNTLVPKISGCLVCQIRDGVPTIFRYETQGQGSVEHCHLILENENDLEIQHEIVRACNSRYNYGKSERHDYIQLPNEYSLIKTKLRARLLIRLNIFDKCEVERFMLLVYVLDAAS